MTAESNRGRLDEQISIIPGVLAMNGDIEYAALVNQIDAFLNVEGTQVRRGTQLKVKESLQVIAKALRDYGYPSNSNKLELVSKPSHYPSTAERIA
jgi:hypothetical protein